MRTGTLHPDELLIIRRLQSVGCPLDYRYLSSQPTYPLRVVSLDQEQGTHIFPMPGKTGVVLPLRMVAIAPITISKYDLRADWLKAPITWNDICPAHSAQHACYCLHETSYGQVKIDLENGLNHRTGIPRGPGKLPAGGVLRPSAALNGFLVGSFPDTTPIATGAKLEATLYITDLLGQEYPFPVVLANRELSLSETKRESLSR